MSDQYGKGHIVGLATFALGIASLSGYVSPLFNALSLQDNGQLHQETNQTGDIDSLVATKGFVEGSFRYTPRGSTIANAILSAGLPSAGAPCTITGLPIIAAAGFTDVLNTNAGNTQPWFYITGSIDGQSEHPGIWTATITLRRYIGVTSGTAIT